jgi:hypothetical protein
MFRFNKYNEVVNLNRMDKLEVQYIAVFYFAFKEKINVFIEVYEFQVMYSLCIQTIVFISFQFS